MDIRVFRSGHGDCLQLTHGSNGRHILVDGGVFDAYEDHWADDISELRNSDEALELVCISHIDRDHIGGILRMLDNEVAWRVHGHQERTARSEAHRARLKEPEIPRPPEIRNVWHNAFLETVRASRRASRRGGVGNATMDLDTLLLTCAEVLSGARSRQDPSDNRGLDPAELARHYEFLGQSVGDAIEVSRRIGPDQLDISHNRQYDGKFVVRRDAPITLGGFSIRVLGPTLAKMRNLLAQWNEWLDDKASYLQRLQRKHDRDAGRLAVADSEDVMDLLRGSALELAGNQRVTPPNLASIILLVNDGDQSVLLTGDADDVDIVEGLKAAGLVDAGSALGVDVFKVPHHGAHNSYSDELARSVIADHYVFCGDGASTNPEPEIIKSYLDVLFEGDDVFHPALGDDEDVKFWFNCGPRLSPPKYKKHWDDVEDVLKEAKRTYGRRFQYHLMSRGQSFLVR